MAQQCQRQERMAEQYMILLVNCHASTDAVLVADSGGTVHSVLHESVRVSTSNDQRSVPALQWKTGTASPS